MNTTTRIRVLIHCRGAGADIFKTLVSLSCQTVGPQRLNIVLASTLPDEHFSHEARLLHSALNFKSLTVLDASQLHPAQALNLAAQAGKEEHLLLAPEGSRLSPQFVAKCLEALQPKQSQAAYPLHTAGNPGRTPLLRIRPFRSDQLVRFNPVGPAVLLRRKTWETLGGLRPGIQLVMWDFWLRLALAGGGIMRVPQLLATCRPLHQLPPWQDGQAKGLLVVGMPGAFEPDVCRWALACLRGDSWAAPFEPGLIPGPREVRAMFANPPSAFRTGAAGWNAQHISTA